MFSLFAWFDHTRGILFISIPFHLAICYLAYKHNYPYILAVTIGLLSLDVTLRCCGELPKGKE